MLLILEGEEILVDVLHNCELPVDTDRAKVQRDVREGLRRRKFRVKGICSKSMVVSKTKSKGKVLTSEHDTNSG